MFTVAILWFHVFVCDNPSQLKFFRTKIKSKRIFKYMLKSIIWIVQKNQKFRLKVKWLPFNICGNFDSLFKKLKLNLKGFVYPRPCSPYFCIGYLKQCVCREGGGSETPLTKFVFKISFTKYTIVNKNIFRHRVKNK